MHHHLQVFMSLRIIFFSHDNIWVLDTGCGSHICNNMKGLRNSRKLTKGEFDLRVGNGVRVAVVAIGTYVLNLPSGLCLNLDNCFYVPALTKTLFMFPI